MRQDSKNESGESQILLDPYMSWAKGEGVPIVEGFGVDLLKIETAPWPRYGVDGGIVHVNGREDFVSVFVYDLPPGGSSSPQRHLYEEVVYVLSGHGSTVVEASDGTRRSFEWGPKSLFALPLNARYRFFNSSGTERARLASGNNCCMMINLFHNDAFVFDNPFAFPDRLGSANNFEGQGNLIPGASGRNVWETNFIADVSRFELKTWNERGGWSSTMMFVLADGTMHAHTSEMPVGTYKKAHRHGADAHVFAVNGHGYSLLWYEGEKDFVRVDWQHGMVFVPPDQMYHQHFNTSGEPSRYLAILLGSLKYPFTTRQRKVITGSDVSVRDGGYQIEYEDQDPRVHQIYLAELAKHGVKSKMGALIDETQATGRSRDA